MGSRLPRLSQIDDAVLRRWPPADLTAVNDAGQAVLATLPIDHRVRPSSVPGGEKAAQKTLRAFITDKLTRYATDRNQPQQHVTSGLSAYLHFGHISAHQVFTEVMAYLGSC